MRIGVDMGGTKIEAIALNAEGRELKRVRVATPRGDYAGTIATVKSLVDELETATKRVGSVGVGIPGTVVASTGLVKNANSTWLNGMPLQRDLSEVLRREVRCANDANCFAVSEATDGAGKGYKVVFGVILGTGCGGGIAIDGKVMNGLNGIAGEWGHIPLPWATGDELPGPKCFCGKRGCLEMWISGTGLELDFETVSGRKFRGEEIVTAAVGGNEQAEAALMRLEDRISRGLAVVANIVDPDVIVLGGGLSKLDRLYSGRVQEKLSELVFGGGGATLIVRNVHGDSSGVRGAAWLWGN